MPAIFLLLLQFILLSHPPTKPELPFSLSKVKSMYQSMYVQPAGSSYPWNGNVETCDCGTLPEDVYRLAERRINFFRRMNGLPDIKINPELNPAAQEAAFIGEANRALAHFPKKSVKCYSELGAKGCRTSNLSFGGDGMVPTEDYVTGFMEDWGPGNAEVGHRRWLLYSLLQEVGYGATGQGEAITVTVNHALSVADLPPAITYPWRGFVPANLIFPRWSFSLMEGQEVDFSQTEVIMLRPDHSRIPVKIVARDASSMDPIIVWEPEGLEDIASTDLVHKKIRVMLKNVKVEGETKNFRYIVIPFDI